MTSHRELWRVVLASAAEADFDRILQWTAEHFGKEQADDYAETLMAAVDALSEGPTITGVKKLDDTPHGVLALHAARQGRKARHLILFRVQQGRGKKDIQVLRILHDAMDLPRHVAPDEDVEH